MIHLFLARNETESVVSKAKLQVNKDDNEKRQNKKTHHVPTSTYSSLDLKAKIIN